MSIEITEDFLEKVIQKEDGIYKSYRNGKHTENANLLAVIFEEDTLLEDIKEDDKPEVKIYKVVQKIKEIKFPSLWLLDMSEWCVDKEIIKNLDLYIKKDSLRVKEFKFSKDESNYVTDKLYFEFTDNKDENAVHIIDALIEIKKNIFVDKEFFNKVDWLEGLWGDEEYRKRIEDRLKVVSQNIIHTVFYDAGYEWIDFLYMDQRDISRIANKNYKFIKEYFRDTSKPEDEDESEKLIGINFENYIFYNGIKKYNKTPYRYKKGVSVDILFFMLECSPAEKISSEKFWDDKENSNGWKSNMDFINLGRKKYDGILNLLFPKDNFPQIRKWDAYIERDDINILNLILREDIEAPELEGIKDEEEIIKIYLEKINNRKDFFIPLQYLDRWTVSEELVKKIPIYVKNNVQQIQAHHLYLERAEKEEKDAVHIIDKLKEAKEYYINKKEIEDLALAEGYYRDAKYKEKIIKIIQELGSKINHLVYACERDWDKKFEFYLHNSDIRRMCRFRKYNFINELFEVPNEVVLDIMYISVKDIGNYKVYEKKWKFEGQDFEADEEIAKILIENRKGEIKTYYN